MRLNQTQFLLSYLLLSSLLIACKGKDEGKEGGGKPAGNNANAPVNAEGFLIHPNILSQDIEAAGSLMPFEKTEVRSEIAGRVTGIYFREGNNVSKGQLLVKLFDADLQAQLKKLQVQLRIAQKTEERQRELLKINGISQQDYDLSSLQVSNIRADMEILSANISRTNIRAPYSGRIGLRNISLGAIINSQTLIATLSQVGQLKLEFSVPEKYGEQMRAGHSVSFSVEGMRNERLANILATENSVDDATRTLKVRAVVLGNANDLIAGSFAKVKVDLGTRSNAIMVPTQAIIPQARNKQVILYKEGTPTFVVVTTGVRQSELVEITNGLKFGDTILVSGLLFVRPNSKIKLTKVLQ